VWARVMTAHIQAGKMNELVSIYHHSLMPTVRHFRGFKGAFLLTSKDSGNAIWISLWETEEDMMSQAASGDFHEPLAEVAHTFVEPASMEHYEISAHE